MEIDKLCIRQDRTIIESIKQLDQTGYKILLVVDEERLIGVITDGDIRRWILKNGDFNVSVKQMMNTNPVCLLEKDIKKADALMKARYIEAIPIVDIEKKVKNVVFWNERFDQNLNYLNKIELPVVIMAGGKGSRLYPYTKIIPKPLIPIGDKTIIERIIDSFKVYGCNDFYLTVNYKKAIIKAYFEELDRNYKISYVEEEKFLGTAGSLGLLRGKVDKTFFLSNCDILVDVNYSHVLKQHKKNRNLITMVTSLKNYILPYGIIKTNEEGRIIDLKEKPELNFQINTGLYIVEPDVLEDIPKDEFIHITDIVNNYIACGKKVGVYPVTEKAWMDMGEIKEMEKMLASLNI